MAITTTIISGVLSTQATSGGTITGDATFVPLVDIILKNKFKLYNRSRQKVTATIKSKNKIKPFQLFEDAMQPDGTVRFVMGGIRYCLTNDSYTVELFEYDNTTDVTLNG